MIENSSRPSGFDTDYSSGESIAHAAVPSDTVTAGTLLREARESTGLHIAALAVALKVPVKKLEALEMDRHDLLPDAVFVRALASSVCRNLKVDPSAILALLPRSGVPTFQTVPSSAQPTFTASQGAMKSASRSSVSISAALLGALLLAGAAVVVFLPAIREVFVASNVAGLAHDAVQRMAAAVRPASVRTDLALDSGADVPVPGIAEVTGPKVALAANADAAADSGGVADGQLTPSERLSPPLAPGNPALTPQGTAASAALKRTSDLQISDRLLTISVTAQSSWVKVTDGKGAVVLSRNIVAGDEAAVTGALPLSVVVGRADATRVMVRGVAFDLGAYSKENVARFEVK